VLDSDVKPSDDIKMYKWKRGNYEGHYFEHENGILVPHGTGILSNIDRIIIGTFNMGRQTGKARMISTD